MYGINFVAIGVCAVLFYFTFIAYKREEINKNSFFLWSFVWIGGIVWVLFSNNIKPLMDALNVGRMLDLTFAFGVLICIVLVFYTNMKFEKMNLKFENLVRGIAIEKAEQEENETKKEESNKDTME